MTWTCELWSSVGRENISKILHEHKVKYGPKTLRIKPLQRKLFPSFCVLRAKK